MRIAYFDCFSGISGDMTIAAFLDAGLSINTLSRELKKLKMNGYEIRSRKVKRGTLVGTKFDCIVKKRARKESRSLKEIFAIIDNGSLKKRVKKTAKDIFANIGVAEAAVHGRRGLNEVHLHELADIDSIIDIVGTAVAVDAMDIDEVRSSAINMGRTFVNTRHGRLPIPAPASLELLRGVPMKISEIEAELVTPTGAGILKTLSKGFGPMPQMKIQAVGYGAGSTIIKDIPNMLRVMIGNLALSLLAVMLFIGSASADTIKMKDGSEIKGIMVEDYKDRLVLSTADGEITVMKQDIRGLSYDTEEENLIKLAELAKERHDHGRAFGYYEMARKINPNSKAAKDGLVFLQGHLFREEQVKKEEAVKLQEEFEHHGAPIIAQKSDEEEFKDAVNRMKKSIGMSLKMKEGLPQIDDVQINSPAYDAGVRKKDLLVAIWGRLTGYMTLKEVIDILLEKPSLEIKCTIERNTDVNANGATFSMEFDGLTATNVKEDSLAFEGGLRPGDLIVSIDGKSTRYMPLKDALKLMRDKRDETIRLTLRRETIIWRKDWR